MRRLAIALVTPCVLVAGCGDSAVQQTACDLLGDEQVVAALRGAGATEIVLRRRSTESLDQSICAYRGRGINVRLNVDSAPDVRRRYFYRVTEAALSSNDPGRGPRPIEALGDADAQGPAGAYWISDFRQLFVLRAERLFIYQLSARGVGAAAARGGAVALARATLPGQPRRSTARPDAGAAGLDVDVLAPLPAQKVRAPYVVVRGIVVGDDAVVRVAGRAARVRDGIFARTVALHRGRNRIRVSASAAGRVRTRAVTVRRDRPARAAGAVFARRRPGVVPDLLAAPLREARAILDGAGLRHRVVRLAGGSLRRGRWTVCRTNPRAGERARGAVVLFADHADAFRTSGTACARD